MARAEGGQRADPIEHVVLLMLENHSFDQMLGCFQEKYPTLEGVDLNKPPRSNLDETGKAYFQVPTTERQMLVDPMHEVEHVSKQIAGRNGGFVRDLQSSYPNSPLDLQKQYIMGCYPRGFLPALHALAESFTICDHWFASVPGPTWTNRFFAWTGTSNGVVAMPDSLWDPNIAGFFQQDQDTVFDALNEKGLSWAVYSHDFPLSWVLTHQRRPENMKRYRPFARFAADCQSPEAAFPKFVLIEPRYSSEDENDDHPPHDVMKAQKLIADVYTAIRSRPGLWEKTLLVVAYDEHGGFYDHVVPPRATPPDDKTDRFWFGQLGIRVPAVLVSPWTSRGFVDTVFDHTSLLKYLSDKWGVRVLGRRTARANGLGKAVVSEKTPRSDTPALIRLTADQLDPPHREIEVEAAQYWSKHHMALACIVHELSREMDLKIPAAGASVGEVLAEARSGFAKLLGY